MIIKKTQISEKDIFPPNMDYCYFENSDIFHFQYRKKTFNINNAWWLAEASFLAYCHPQFIRLVYLEHGFKNFKAFIGKNVSRAFIAYNRKFAIVSFRGTELKSLKFFSGAVTDLSFNLTDVKIGRVHSGFNNALDEIWHGDNGMEIFLTNLKRKYPFIKIWFTGHSLGAAMATIAAARFKKCTGTYTFGSPRAGDVEFAKSIETPVFRIVNNSDPITHLPPKKINILSSEQNFKHIGILKFITKNLEIIDEPDKSPMAKIPDFRDHSPILYAINLKSML